jgi:two-component system chemotaxis response regulator CheB
MDSLESKMIRVFVVEDSPLMCKILVTLLNNDPQILVVGVARDGKEALDFLPHLKPDIMTLDMDLPVVDGLEVTRQVMTRYPTPILIVSSSVFKTGMEKVFRAISWGALDVMDKSDLISKGEGRTGEELIEKIKSLTRVKPLDRTLLKFREEKREVLLKKTKGGASHRMVAIVASTGGPQALLKILKPLPEDFPCGIVIVQHIASGFLPGMVDWLNKECKIRVKVGEDQEIIQAGVAYIAPDHFQMRVVEGGRISLSDEPPTNGHRPSGDILLESVARVYGKGSIGIILTGMGKDGVLGMKAIKQVRGKTIAQDEKSCVVFGMPHAAIETGAVDQVLSLEKIAEELLSLIH